MSTNADVRQLATAMPGVREKSSYGTPAFYVRGKIFAGFHEEPGVLVCWRRDVDDREVLLAADPRKFFTTDHYKGHASVLVRLECVDIDELAELLTEAWQARGPGRLAKGRNRRDARDSFARHP